MYNNSTREDKLRCMWVDFDRFCMHSQAKT